MAEFDEPTKKYLLERAKAELMGALGPNDVIPSAFPVTRADIEASKVWASHELKRDLVFPEQTTVVTP